jgi:hypothetical protein
MSATMTIAAIITILERRVEIEPAAFALVGGADVDGACVTGGLFSAGGYVVVGLF